MAEGKEKTVQDVFELYCTAFSAHSLARYFVTIILSYTKYSNNYVN